MPELRPPAPSAVLVARRHALARGSLALLLGLPLLALLPAGLLIAGCTDEAPRSSPGLTSDAGSTKSCVLGSSGCGCTSSGGCDPGLLCNTGRCYPAEGTEQEPDDPYVRPTMPAPVSQPDSSPDASTDSGPSSNG
ncbi:MAG TPA: hypothetical protein VFS67_07975 [Polyangiaceae bacterium]|jgi:hypothetical protein|nr:hypothetical protein [Polyangiaceae bacterium]